MATATITADEQSQLMQTIEMFEVIVQSQPDDCQSLEILKEAYTKLEREEDIINTSKRIAQAYVGTGQLSSAILEYETILQLRPNDTEAKNALKQIEDKAHGTHTSSGDAEPAALATPQNSQKAGAKKSQAGTGGADGDRKTFERIFVEGKIISADDFEACWRTPDLTVTPSDVIEPFIHTLAEKKILPVEKSLKLLSDKSRTPFLTLEKYDVDIELTRGFPAEVCRRWCVLPFDKMSKAILVATANPFNQLAARELAESTSLRLLWYLASPAELMQNIRKTFH